MASVSTQRELRRAQLELAEAEEHLSNALGHLNTPIARRKLDIHPDEPWLRDAAAWLQRKSNG